MLNRFSEWIKNFSDGDSAMPTEDELKKMPVEHEPKEKEPDTLEKAEAKKMFPYRLKVTPKTKLIPIILQNTK